MSQKTLGIITRLARVSQTGRRINADGEQLLSA